jgi:hypothetical protein
MSITDQITVIPACLVHSIIVVYCTTSLPFSFPRKCHYSEKFSRSYGNYQGTAKSWRSPCAILSQGEYSLSIALSYSLRRSGVAISTAMAAGLASASRILMAGKPPVGTDCRQELSRAPLTTAFLTETAVLSGRAVSAGGE